LEDIQNIEDNISVLISQSGLQQYFTTVKNHYTPFIVLFETPENSSAEAGEMAHKIQVKKHHEASNHKNPEKFVLSPFFPFLFSFTFYLFIYYFLSP